MQKKLPSERKIFSACSSCTKSNSSNESLQNLPWISNFRSVIPEKVAAFEEILTMLIHAPCKITREHIQV